MRKLTHDEIQAAKAPIEEVKKRKRFPVYAVLDNIRSMHNVGAIFRTSDACLIEKIFLCGMTAVPPRKEISKTALGAEELVPFEYHKKTVDAVKKLKKAGVKIIGLELADGAAHFKDVDYEFPCALVIGHEVNGIYDEVFELLDEVVQIPMHGRANSLNVATAYGIMAYELIEQYKRR